MEEPIEIAILAEGRPTMLRELEQVLLTAGHDVRIVQPPGSGG